MPMMLTGKTYDAKKAKKIGLVDMVVEPIGKQFVQDSFDLHI